MSVLAHPGPISFSTPRRRHLTVVPSLPDVSAAPDAPAELADVIALPVAPPAAVRPAPARPAVARPAATRPAETAAPLRLTVRGRAVLAGLAILSAAVVGSVAGSIASASSTPEAGMEVVTVSTGDSLWSIASEVAAPGTDVRDVMSEIAEINGLEGATLVAGQQLTVPQGD